MTFWSISRTCFCRCLLQLSCRHIHRYHPPEFKGLYKQKISHKQLEAFWKLSNTGTEHKSVEVSKQQETAPHYPEVLPSRLNPDYRNQLMESFERKEMMRRRLVMNIPEFYVGSILAVTVHDPYSPNKSSKFVGICILRYNAGLYSQFSLRNVVDKVSIQIDYQLYNPTITSIEVLKLEKRLDDNLLYLTDAPVEYSTVPFTFTAIPHPAGQPAPINKTKVVLNPPPWKVKWYLHGFNGIDEESMFPYLDEETLAKIDFESQSIRRYDLLQNHLEEFSLRDKDVVYSDIHVQHEELMRQYAVKKQQEMRRQVVSASSSSR